MEFKDGDKLRYIGAKSHYYTVDSVYELQEKCGDTVWVTDDESNEVANHEWDFWDLEANFERVDELQPQTDRVELQQADTDTLDAWLNHTAYSVVNGFDEQYAQGVKKGILLTLDAYGIKVKGINAK